MGKRDTKQQYDNTINQQLEQLQSELDKSKFELEKRIRECESLSRELESVRTDIDLAIRLSGQSRYIIESIRESVSGIANNSSDIIGTIKQLRENQLRIRGYCTELQKQNNQLTEQLGRIQESAN